ncbi:S8 family serine peptidase, partial [Nonomuraea aridisoli]
LPATRATTPSPTTTGPTTTGPTTTGSAAAGAASGGLDRNLGQVAAPQAWRAGYTGKGVRVAVLDTGADFSHPDLAGQVAERADFTVENGDAVDRQGHGTHVAATIAGTGAAARGERRGVAPDARLVVGKVLDDSGFGMNSQIIAGMEWAASRADVVNMSLGGEEPSDGTDPLSLAVDALTEQTGALFVIAAGNTGGAIGSPAAATAALTVGAVDGADALADFSSRGPLVGTRAAKPELVAPGVGIVAARAAGTTLGDPVDARYTASSGTSMATPHVAGAAALLAQRHPGWTAQRLKAALVGAADPLPGTDPYSVGAGRLDAAGALSGPVSDQPVVALGTFRHPQAGTAEAKLSWTGDETPAAVTLDLDVTVADHTGRPAPRGAASLSQTRVRLKRGVPAGVTLRLGQERFAGRAGLFAATVTARRPNGTAVATTPVTFYVEPPSHDLTVRTVPMPGLSPESMTWANVLVTNLDDPLLYAGGAFTTPGETVTLRVPDGRYAVTAAYSSYDPVTSRQTGTLVGDSDVAVTADHAMTLDTARAAPLTATVDGVRTRTVTADFTYLQTSRTGLTWYDVVSGWGEGSIVSAGALERPGIGSLRAYGAFGLESPADAAEAYLYQLVHDYGDAVPADPAYRVTPAEQARLARVDQRFHQMDSPGMVTSLRRYGFTRDGWYLTQHRTYDLPVTRTDYLSPGLLWQDEGIYGGLLAQEGAREYGPGSRESKTWARQPLHSDWYDDPVGAEYTCAQAPYRTRGNLHVDLVMLTDRHQRADCLAAGTIGVRRTLSLHRDGRLVDERDASRADFTVPEQAADYRLTLDVDTSLILPVSTRVTTSWTFRSAGPRDTGAVPLPLLSVDYALPLDAANHAVGGAATFSVRQAHGVPARRVTSFQVWTSTDDGATWRPAEAGRTADGYRAELPAATPGQAVSLRVKAGADGGSGIDQTIIRAYRAD